MAVYGVVADIHGNREALAAAFAALEARGVERVVCLGDIIGYNADPDECVAMVRGPALLYGGDVRAFHAPAGAFAGVFGGPPCPDFSPALRTPPRQNKCALKSLRLT